ncbi:MAG: HD domain-containing protein [Clostridiales bacterium]|nr:HD domain-containing protein [Clostridiales bacterium]
MKQEQYICIENEMLRCMRDSAHDREHVYRVLYTALMIAETEPEADRDILITASLLHDIGRKEQFENPALCHAAVGAKKAETFLLEKGFAPDFTEKVCAAILSHRFRKNASPESIEAKILFDADKLDACGALGIARTLVYKGAVEDPLYSLLPDGSVSDGTGDEFPSFFQEYKFKLEKLYDRFYTKKGREMAEERRAAAISFYRDLFGEVSAAYITGRDLLQNHIK